MAFANLFHGLPLDEQHVNQAGLIDLLNPYGLLGGVLGLGIGDIALFHALPRIGVGLTMLLTQCLAAPFALILEYEILGLSPNGPQLLSALVILAGVGVAFNLLVALRSALRAPIASRTGSYKTPRLSP